MNAPHAVWSSRDRTQAQVSGAQSVVNDVHSRLNRTTVPGILRPRSVGELREVVRRAAESGSGISLCGGRHAMGGQQFAEGMALVDMASLNRIVDMDGERGLVTVEAGADWLQLVNHLVWASAGEAGWGIIQKQTGADRLTLGGALAANIHGRGLRMRPIVADVESFDIVTPSGELAACSRAHNPHIFSLAIGGYGLLGPIARVTLRLSPRHKLQRCVTMGSVEDAARVFEMRSREGFEYGDFQFAIDPASPEFLRAGVFSCYRPVPADTPIPAGQRSLRPGDWHRLLRLAHTHKSEAFAEYARYYSSTDGQVYWSDTHQLAEYPEAYHEELDAETGASIAGSEMISELYVPRAALAAFMSAVRADARRHDFDIIYGTIRSIEPDDETFLAWAREPWACIVFNLHVDHTPEGIAKAASNFRRLIDRAIEQGGSYYLTYHRWASAEQVRACHPRLAAFLEQKRRYDPDRVFRSDWHVHHERLFARA
jgi:FAD/FMN-containing dehydrogenase